MPSILSSNAFFTRQRTLKTERILLRSSVIRWADAMLTQNGPPLVACDTATLLGGSLRPLSVLPLTAGIARETHTYARLGIFDIISTIPLLIHRNF